MRLRSFLLSFVVIGIVSTECTAAAWWSNVASSMRQLLGLSTMVVVCIPIYHSEAVAGWPPNATNCANVSQSCVMHCYHVSVGRRRTECTYANVVALCTVVGMTANGCTSPESCMTEISPFIQPGMKCNCP